jgi:hypothetical protein
MGLNDPLASFPQRMTVTIEGRSRDYYRESDCFAIHGALPPALTTAVVFSFEDPDITVCRGHLSSIATIPADRIITPVYRLGQKGPQGVPTGRIFIRFQSSVRVLERLEDLQSCGFTIQETLSYAPHAAWLRSMDGRIDTVLNSYQALQGLCGVMVVEPQMLMRREQR